MRNQPDERSVYLALNNIFRGADAQLRKPKKIRELILKCRHHINVRNLIEAHNIENVCNVAKNLLEQQIFESTLKAKIRFPEVFEVSPAQSAERSVSEQEAARSEADAIQNFAESSARPAPTVHDDGLEKNAIQEFCGRIEATPRVTLTLPVAFERSATSLGKRKQQNASSSTPSLYPVYLPYQTQHKLLTNAQVALEKRLLRFRSSMAAAGCRTRELGICRRGGIKLVGTSSDGTAGQVFASGLGRA